MNKMPKLDLIVPHYKEDIALFQPMLDILKIQRNVDFDDFRVLIVCDGEDIVLPEGYGQDMPFKVESITIPHGGISVARNAGLDYSQADWVMFCDSDDAFMTTISLQTFFRYTKPDKGLIASAFFEEAPSTLPKDKRMMLLWHSGKDYIFVHGKMWNRKWLVKNKIRFNDNLQLHEDAYFVAMAKYLLSDQDTVYIKDPLYLWQYNVKSVTRSHHNFVLQTYDQLVKKNSALTEALLHRGMFVQAKGIVCRTITDAYCRLNSKSWNTRENRELVKDAEDSVALFLKHYDYIFKGSGDVVINAGLDSVRDQLIGRGDFDKTSVIPFEDWVARLRK